MGYRTTFGGLSIPTEDGKNGNVTCEECGYSLHGITSERCPECGALIDDPFRVMERSHQRRLVVGSTIISGVVGAIVSFVSVALLFSVQESAVFCGVLFIHAPAFVVLWILNMGGGDPSMGCMTFVLFPGQFALYGFLLSQEYCRKKYPLGPLGLAITIVLLHSAIFVGYLMFGS